MPVDDETLRSQMAHLLMDQERRSRGAHARMEYFRAMQRDPMLRAFYENWRQGAEQTFEDMLLATIVALSQERGRLQNLTAPLNDDDLYDHNRG